MDRQYTPGGACKNDPAQGVEHTAQLVLTLRCGRIHQRQVRCCKAPFFKFQISVLLAGIGSFVAAKSFRNILLSACFMAMY